jgi:23S rRNA (adenine2503-C2)-methyltransferase
LEKLDIKSMTAEEIGLLIREIGEPSYRAQQIFHWLHQGVVSFDEMSNLSKTLRQKLDDRCYIADTKIIKRLESKIDGTVKYLFGLNDGETVESVLMKYNHGYTVCISTQVGCRMGCKFCASGLFGLKRNLTASEMLSQIMTAQKDNCIRVSNVVMMGMGEPLDNFENSARFLKLVSDEKGMNIGLRHISLSTSGVVDGIYKLAQLNLPITLSISLHAPTDEIRSKTMPVNKKWNIEKLLKACKDYQKVTTRRISFEYAMIQGVNDTEECAKTLCDKLKGIMCHVNLIPANPVVETDFIKSDIKRIENFKAYLEKSGITATIRRTLGADINASCGQLRRQEERKEEN